MHKIQVVWVCVKNQVQNDLPKCPHYKIHAIWQSAKKQKLCIHFYGENAEKGVDYMKNMLDYAEIWIFNKVDNKAFPMYQTTVKWT